MFYKHHSSSYCSSIVEAVGSTSVLQYNDLGNKVHDVYTCTYGRVHCEFLYCCQACLLMISLSTFAGMVICEEIQCDYVC